MNWLGLIFLSLLFDLNLSFISERFFFISDIFSFNINIIWLELKKVYTISLKCSSFISDVKSLINDNILLIKSELFKCFKGILLFDLKNIFSWNWIFKLIKLFLFFIKIFSFSLSKILISDLFFFIFLLFLLSFILFLFWALFKILSIFKTFFVFNFKSSPFFENKNKFVGLVLFSFVEKEL